MEELLIAASATLEEVIYDVRMEIHDPSNEVDPLQRDWAKPQGIKIHNEPPNDSGSHSR
jgi:hypothetical protein